MPSTAAKPIPSDSETDLILSRTVDVLRAKMWKGLTDPALLKQWFAPAPWKIADVTLDLRPGGLFKMTMRSPEGEDFPHSGCVLEVVPNEKLVWTDALGPGYRPSEKPFFSVSITLEDKDGGTLYTAHAMHKDAETRKAHEDMGFHDGWGKCLDQLVQIAKAQ
jgi:uncharacterized protein YndB with AHSA1/START domain